jgi:glucan biosynthesis protein C
MPTEIAGAEITAEPPIVSRLVIAGSQALDKSRLFYIDNLRVGLITLVILGHMSITYGAPIGDWYYREEGDVGIIFSIISMLLLGIGSSFLLGLFYMIAGYFTPRPYDRKGASPFILDRLKRLGIPLILYAFVINPLVTYWAAVHGGYVGSSLQYVPDHLADLERAAVGPLWFVEALLVFSILYAIGRIFTQAALRFKPDNQPEAQLPGNRAIALFALSLGLLTFLVRIWVPVGWWWEPLHQEPAHFPQYLTLFAIGIIAYRKNWFARLSTKQARLWGWVALAFVPLLPALMVAAGVLSGEINTDVAGGLNWLSFFYSMWEGFIGTAMVVTVLVWFRDHFDRQGRLLQRMSAASYAVYVLHPMLIVPLALVLSDIRLGLSLKFVVVAPLAVAICFSAGHYIRKLPLIRNIL